MYTRNLLRHSLWISLLTFGLGIIPVGAVAKVSSTASATTLSDAKASLKSTPALPAHTTMHEAPTLPPGWLALPFAVLLLMIATGPLLYAQFWHRHYPKVALLLAGLVVSYYMGAMNNYEKPVEALMEYIQFIALIAALYMASGGILIKINKAATPIVNLTILLIGAVIANLIGTTGASMLLVRPYIRLNAGHIKVYHIVFFIFMVSNVGGALTPIGDPPLFLGFLSGVPFLWTLQHNFLPWLTAVSLLGGIFYAIDARHYANAVKGMPADATGSVLQVSGKHNFVWLALIIAAVFIDPNIYHWVPALHYGHHGFSFVREVILLGIAWGSCSYANREVLQQNAFDLEPLREVSLLFIGIFGTMIPALELISAFASSEAGQALITHNTLYWGAGIFSSMLDNAPTYLNFTAASMAAEGADIAAVADVQAFATGGVFYQSVVRLRAISVASVFFGAMTYIGNGPNFMVKAIAEGLGIRMPSFFGYMIQFSVPILLPILVLVWVLFFAFV
ncbi:MAG: sodium:proton antiporter [Bacteroidota bacterium]